MIDYLDLLEEQCPHILEKCYFTFPDFTNEDKLFYYLDDIKKNRNKKILIFGDSDCDGVFAGKIIEIALQRIGALNVEFYKYRKRSHILTDEVVMKCIYQKFDYIFIPDSSTSDLYNIERLARFNCIPIVLDHHRTDVEYSQYPEKSVVINTTLENKIRNKREFMLSGGALCFCLFSKYLSNNNLEWEDLSAYALITLYSDCISMTPPLNRAIYYMATSLPINKLPLYCRHFMNSYNRFNRRFIEYTFAPKINSLFRAGKLKLLNNYLLDNHNQVEYSRIVESVKECHAESREVVKILSDIVHRKVYNNLVLASIENIDIATASDELYHYTGLIANNLSQEYGKPCVVMCDTGSYIKASFRDLYSRNYLDIFKQFSDARGHDSAFAINIPYLGLENFKHNFEIIDKKFSILGVRDIVEIPMSLPSEEVVNDIALYNEFSSIDIPIAVIVKRNDLTCKKSFSSTYPYKYKWGNFYIESKSRLLEGCKIKIKPVLTHKIRLISYNRRTIL